MFRAPFLICLATIALGCATHAAAAPKQDAAASHFAPASAGMTEERAAAVVRKLLGGRILAARPVERAGESGFSVRVLTEDGRVKNVFVDRFGTVSER